METDSRSLLEAARLGDQAAWDTLVAEFNGLVWAIVRSYRLGIPDASDAVQMTWLRLVENLDRINDPDRLAGWLATTARRECLQLLRKSGRVSLVGDELLQNVPDNTDPVESGLLLAERDSALWGAFSLMGERCQRLLRVLMTSPPPSYRAVSDALDMPIGTIGPSRQRCLEQLRRLVTTSEQSAPDWSVGDAR